MAGLKQVPSASIGDEQLAALVKHHFSQLSVESKDFDSILLALPDDVVARYEQFFAFLATSNKKFNAKQFLHALKQVLRGDNHKMADFSQKILKAFAEIKYKKARSTSGKKLSPSMGRICRLYKCNAQKDSQTDLQSSTDSQLSLPSPSKTPLKRAREAEQESPDTVQKAKDLWGIKDTPKRVAAVLGSPVSVQSSPGETQVLF